MHTAPLIRTVVEIVGHPFHVLCTPEDGAIRAAGFATESDPEAASLEQRLAEADAATAARGVAPVAAALADDGRAGDADGGSAAAEHARRISAGLDAYAAGDLAAIDSLEAAQPETPFRGEVWRALRGVAPGRAVTYRELAALAGRPSAVRAAASGCANNLVALIVPCHRIVRTDGGLGGYLFGTEIKEALLQHEGAIRPTLL